ncbi:MAG: tetratricopeptide repeat protein [Thermodesulfovibrionales bacterium]
MQKMISADEYFMKGIQLLGEANLLGALACFERAHIQETSPLIQSYLGYCIATERGQIAEALNLCRAAIERDPHNPEHYLNLGRVYLKAKKKDEAIAELRRGLSFGNNQDIKALLEGLGLRKNPVFSFLSRDHVLNKSIGLILSRLRLR